MKIYKLTDGIEYWYDNSYKTWYAAKFDAEGNQIGDSINSYQKADIIWQAQRDL